MHSRSVYSLIMPGVGWGEETQESEFVMCGFCEGERSARFGVRSKYTCTESHRCVVCVVLCD